MTTTYNGWKNRETWNVALWLNNDESLYRLMWAYGKDLTYQQFAEQFLTVFRGDGTPDGVLWLDDSLDYDALTEMLEEVG
jgi:hypothetical protein